MNKAGVIQDAIPQEDFLETSGPNEAGMVAQRFFAFNTAITLQAFAGERDCLAAFGRVRKEARRLERLFSRTLPHSDISRLNRAEGTPVEISRNTADLLECALSYCADSDGRFDITMGSAVQLWDLRRAIIPSQNALREAVAHVDWRGVRIREESGRYFAQLADPQAAVDVGGIAKGWIADKFTSVLLKEGLKDFLINLGGNVVAHGKKPGDIAWNIGIRDPRDENSIVGAVPLCDASAVTSGIYERCCKVNGKFYHHILSPETGMPVQTDVAGATVIADRSIDAEGYSTTLLALGTVRGLAFAREHPAIRKAIFVTSNGDVLES